MAKITPQIIQEILTNAQAEGLDQNELSALREALLMRAVDLTGEQRLNLALAQLDDAVQEDVDNFVSFYMTLSDGLVAKGSTALNQMSEAEWQRLVNGE